MKTLIIASAVTLLIGVAYIATHLALIEIGQEIVVLHKPMADGTVTRTRLWIVDGDGATWLHHGYGDSYWIQAIEADPVVTLERRGQASEYRATADRPADPRVHRLLREKYGVADRLVRFWVGTDSVSGFATRTTCQAVPVRLEPL